MCGIAGAIGRIDERIVHAVRVASDRQRHRGPDADGFHVETRDGVGIAFAHRRLAIIDLSEGGIQPKRDPETGATIVFNGEIYNYRELRSELRSAGAHFRTASDTEVLLQAYLHWGEDCLQRLVGMFAFAIWDPRTQRVFLARDRLGIKPLHFLKVGRPGEETLLFASELRALLATGLTSRKLDPIALQTYLWHGFVVGDRSLVDGVRRLQPGVAATVSLDTPEPQARRYWALPREAPLDDAEERLASLLQDAVRCRLIADVPVGIFLSGGIDSSAVTALAARAAHDRLRTFNVRFRQTGFDESPHAAAVARELGTQHEEIDLSTDEFEYGLDAALGSLDQPSFDAINTYFVSRAVRAAGVTVALAGTGGDEIFAGYPSFSLLPRLARLGALARLPAQAAQRALARLLPAATRLRVDKLIEALSQRGRLADIYQVSCALFTPSPLLALAPDLDWGLTRLGLPASMPGVALPGETPEHAISNLELASFVGERLLPDTDSVSMAVALEVRVPLLDHRVVEAAAQVPHDRRFLPLGRKQLLRDHGLRQLPPSMFERPKHGFELPMRSWMTGEGRPARQGGIRERVEALLLDEASCTRVGLSATAVHGLWRAFLESPALYWSRPWSLFVLLDWCRREQVYR